MEDGALRLGAYLRAARERQALSLRAVERATGISNPYLSQLESGKIRQPSPIVLHKLSELYGVPYASVMVRAGYPVPGAEAADLVVDSRLGPITPEEERALREYLDFLRSKRTKRRAT